MASQFNGFAWLPISQIGGAATVGVQASGNLSGQAVAQQLGASPVVVNVQAQGSLAAGQAVDLSGGAAAVSITQVGAALQQTQRQRRPGAKTFLEICREIRSACGLQGDGPSTVIAQTGIYEDVVRWAKDVYAEIQAMPVSWTFMRGKLRLPISPGLDTYTPGLPPWEADAASRIVALDNRDCWISKADGTEKQRVEVLAYDDFVRLKPSVMQTTRPSYITMAPPGQVELDVVPNDHYILYAGVELRAHIMAADDDMPVFPDEFHALIVHKAVARYARKDEAFELKREAERDARLLLSSMLARCTEPIVYRAYPLQ